MELLILILAAAVCYMTFSAGRTSQTGDRRPQTAAPATARLDDYLARQPASSCQQEYLKFFGFASKGVTASEAGRVIAYHRVKRTNQETREWAAYMDIIEEFNDPDFRVGFGLGKVSGKTLSQAINGLKRRGKTCEYLYAHIEEVVVEVKAVLGRPS
jgi:hypothetical protein